MKDKRDKHCQAGREGRMVEGKKGRGVDRKQLANVSVGLHIITFSLHNMGKEIVVQATVIKSSGPTHF